MNGRSLNAVDILGKVHHGGGGRHKRMLGHVSGHLNLRVADDVVVDVVVRDDQLLPVLLAVDRVDV